MIIVIIIVVEQSLIFYNIDIYYHNLKLGNSFGVTVMQTAYKHTAVSC
jgi:hypothetical protein